MRRRELTVIIGSLFVVAVMAAGGAAWHAKMADTNHHAAQPGSPSSPQVTEPDHDDLDRAVVPPFADVPTENTAELLDPSVLAGLNMGVDDSYPGDAWFREASGEEGIVDASDETAQPPESDGRPSANATSVRLDVPQSVQETGYWCVPASVQMVLRYKGIDVSQSALASEMSAKPQTGTEYVDLARVVNKYLFGVGDANPIGAGYRVQTVEIGDTDPAVARTFAKRAKTDLDDGYPVFVAIDVHTLYPSFAHANHMIVITGYDADATGAVTHWTYRDPWYRVQGEAYAGLKIATAHEMVNAIVSNEEPAYIW
ncbi:C39 family peptidase [Bifidobacterium simiiventris]|uniref:C39 family peptidase n=1 Tax=Bifidobacterium simiiventris TaxID=2834434 RepID=UPI001C55ED89|nr:C39 family peptidase [Bifidobacterium simiiventris]MBW3079620.1 C39 family peptidase [Bifidobacterium simiiventris]